MNFLYERNSIFKNYKMSDIKQKIRLGNEYATYYLT